MSTSLHLTAEQVKYLKPRAALHAKLAGARYNGGAMPILRTARLSIGGGIVAVSTTDLDITLETRQECDSLDCGLVHVDAKALKTAVDGAAKAKSGLVLECDDDHRVTFSYAGVGSSSSGPIDYADWPASVLELERESDRFDLSRTALTSVTGAVATDGTRPILGGVLVETDGTYVATDSYRLHKCEAISSAAYVRPPRNLLIPATGLAYLLKLASIAKVSDTAAFAARADSKNVDMHATDGDRVLVRLIDGEFPNYRTLFERAAAEACETFVVDTDRFRDAVAFVTSSSKSEGCAPEIALRVTREGDKVRVARLEPDKGTWSADIDAGADCTSSSVAFNPAYLLPALTDADGKTAVHANLQGVNELKPWCLSWHSTGHNHARLLMPVRVS